MTCQPAFTYNDAQFRAQFPAFANTATYPATTISGLYDVAGLYVQNTKYGWLARACATQYALYLLTAHLLQIQALTLAGQQPAIMTGAGIDKISVTVLPPEVPNAWQFWLQTTTYGSALLALLNVTSAGGLYTPGSLGRRGFSAAFPQFPYGRC